MSGHELLAETRLSRLPKVPSVPMSDRRALPMTRAEAIARGWVEVDVVLVSGDAYVDHPSFAAAILGRVLEAAGYRVGIVAQPDWRNCEAWREFGRPRLFYGISAGNMDSMINHYTANRKLRNRDAYSPGGRIGLRPDRATLAYCQRAREAYRGVPVIAGGVEASLRRVAHYDYWSDRVRRSILLDSKADLLVFGMGEGPILEIAKQLAAGQSVRELRSIRGIAYPLGASEPPPAEAIELPSFEQVRSDLRAFSIATRITHQETNPFNARRLFQRHDRQAVVVNPPQLPISQRAMDGIYGLPYTRHPHPSYRDPIPAMDTIKDSVTILRGCFGGCAFCSITTHQGRIVQSRSAPSVVAEVRSMTEQPSFTGIVSDLGGPTANMYRMRCSRSEVEARCRRQSCVFPSICKLLRTEHEPLIELMRAAREVPGIRKVMVASGVRMDLAIRSPEYIAELTEHHVGGRLKVAPEHTDPRVLEQMRKPPIEHFREFTEAFEAASQRLGRRQYLVPYFIASHPGSDLGAMIDLAVFLKRSGYRPDQVQDFIPAPMDVATSVYYTGLDPFTLRPVPVARKLRDRRSQRALMQFFKPENYFEVRRALLEAGRPDLIGSGCDCLIPARPPREAVALRMRSEDAPLHADFVHAAEGGGGAGGAAGVPAACKAARQATGKKASESSASLRRSSRQSRLAAGRGYRPYGKKSRGAARAQGRRARRPKPD